MSLPFFGLGAEFEMHSYGTISVAAPDGWSIRGREALSPNGKPLGYNLVIRSRGESSAKCMLTLIYSTNAVPSKESVRQTVLRIGQQYVEGSVERKENLKEFSLTNGYGFYCMFTDASLVGKRLQPDDYRVMGTGEIQLNGNLTGAISLFANEAEGDEFKTMVRIIDSLKVKSKDAK